MLFYSLNWSRKKYNRKINRITVEIKGLTADGETMVIQKKYDEWLGICTKNIDKTLKLIRYFFPGIELNCIQLNSTQYKKILPNFKERLFKENKLIYKPKYFYKIYSNNAYIYDIGILMDKYKIAYYTPEDWLTRLYIDICTSNNCNNFFYMWYNVSNEEMLLDSMKINVCYTEKPDIKIASFDLETISLDGGNRIPTGHDEQDRIVMISVVKWNYKYDDKIEKVLLYLNPINTKKLSGISNSMEFSNEKEMLLAFYVIIKDCHILTGYNIKDFDFPCLLARTVLLNMKNEINMYSSKKIGSYTLLTLQDKIVIDMIIFIKVFSKHGLTGFKLDDVAKCKLQKSKFPIKPTTIQHYYTYPAIDADALMSKDKALIYAKIQPKNLDLSEFGTFLDCCEYCLEDSVLVYELFKKELVLTFLIERANVTSINVEQALCFGNTRYILEVFKSFSLQIGYFINVEFFKNTVEADLKKYKDFLIFKKNTYTYQGALNFGIPGTFAQNVAGLDFLSMYPSILINQNLSYETSGLIPIDDYLKLPEHVKSNCECVPYRTHSENDIKTKNKFNHDKYNHPEIDFENDKLIMISYKKETGFLPRIINIFLEKRKEIQRRYKETKENALFTRQLNIKLFLNSVYGCMASMDSPLAYLDIAMTITCFARLYLLATSEFTEQVLGYYTAYCDTDSIFVENYPYKDCNLINNYLGQKYMILQFEKVMTHLLVISKKRYVYEENNEYKMAGFENRANAITRWIAKTIVFEVLNALKKNERDIGQGLLIWVNTLVQAFSMCKDAKKYCITRKTRQLHEYKSTSCPQLKIIKENPSKAGDFIDYTYSQTDTSASQSTKWIMEKDKCEEVNFEKLFISQEKIVMDLLNIAFFQISNPLELSRFCKKVLNVMRWKSFVNAEIVSYMKYKKPIMLLVLKSVKYTFNMNI